MRKILYQIFCAIILSSSFIACSDDDNNEPDEFPLGNTKGVFILNQGTFNSSSSTLSYYDPESGQSENDVFARINNFKLGDIAQSMTIHNGTGYIVVNNSGVIFSIDIKTMKVQGKIDNLGSPRHMHFISDEKAYVTDLYAPVITIVNPKTMTKTGETIAIESSSEQMIPYKNFIFTNCWSYGNKILVIDTNTDEVVGSIQTGLQPAYMVKDKNNKIWTITSGGYEGSPQGYEAPTLCRIDAETRTVEKTFYFQKGEWISGLSINKSGDTFFYIKNDIWKMNITDNDLPTTALISNTDWHTWNAIAVNPDNSDIYLADAIDYQQAGMVYRYNATGSLLGNFQVGVIPGGFCFK